MTNLREIVITYDWDVYLGHLDRLVEHVDRDFEEWLEDKEYEAQRIHDEDMRDEFYMSNADEYHGHEQSRVVLINSFFLACVALFEHQMVQVCRRAQRQTNCPFSVKDLGYSVTNNVKKYCEGLGIEFPWRDPEWGEIKGRYGPIRNKIAHEGGDVYSDSDKDLFDYARENGIGSIRPVGPQREKLELELTPEYCKKAIRDFKAFILKLQRAKMEGVQTQSASQT